MKQKRLRLPVSKLILGLSVLALLTVSGSAKAWWDGNWSYRKQITVDAGPKGGALPADAGRMPLLIRLHDGNFKFTDAKDDGSDIRFVAGDDKTPLKFHLDTYDGLLGVALIWVDIPAVPAGQTTDIFMYWGNANAQLGGDPKGTYDADTTLVYHFGDKDAAPHDQTANANNAGAAVRSIDTGMIGRGIHLDGASPIVLPTSPSLALPQGGQFTWSAWVKFDAPQADSVLFSKSDPDGGSLVIGMAQGAPYVAVTAAGATVRGAATAPVSAAAWHHIAVTVSDHVALFVDGKPAATAAATLPALAGAGIIGGDAVPAAAAAAPAAVPAAASAPGFIGDFDELELSKVARPAGFIAAAAASQGPDAAMVVYGADEENAGMSGGYFGVILRSVTIDGWVVIGILGVMMAVSVTVMVNKAIYITRVARANAPFLDLFGRYGADADALREQLRAYNGPSLERSPAHRIYLASEEELARRTAGMRTRYLILSSQAVDTLRANLDRVSVKETERLNSMIVLLTIAISGGPFLGLLGTVVGVMITFAAIAASGDVNVNAIAPGIAAALVATVAGLAVAIPALFGYNYLIAKIKDVTTEMHGFTEELVTRIAETYAQHHDPEKLAAE
jgi:biopolymer transport protein ExbB